MTLPLLNNWMPPVGPPTAPPYGLFFGTYQVADPVLVDGTMYPPRVDSAGRLIVSVAGSGSSGTLAVGVKQVALKFTQAITATGYTGGFAVGAIMTLTGAAGSSGGSGVILGATVTDLAHNAVQYDILIFDANPAASTVTNNAAMVVGSGDVGKWIGTISIGAFFAGAGATQPNQGQNFTQPIPFVAASGTPVYAALVTRGAPTYVSTGDVAVTFQVSQNG